MRLLNQVVAAGLLLLGLYIVQQGREYQFTDPTVSAGPGFLPVLVGVGIVILSSVQFVKATRNEPRALAPGTIPDRGGLARLAAIIIPIFGVILVLESLGFRVTMFLYFTFTMLALGRLHPVVALGGAAVGSLGIFWLFNDVLMVTLPVGGFGF